MVSHSIPPISTYCVLISLTCFPSTLHDTSAFVASPFSAIYCVHIVIIYFVRNVDTLYMFLEEQVDIFHVCDCYFDVCVKPFLAQVETKCCIKLYKAVKDLYEHEYAMCTIIISFPTFAMNIVSPSQLTLVGLLNRLDHLYHLCIMKTVFTNHKE